MTCEAGTSHREENAKKKRNRRNALDLVGHILSVVMEVLILASFWFPKAVLHFLALFEDPNAFASVFEHLL